MINQNDDVPIRNSKKNSKVKSKRKEVDGSSSSEHRKTVHLRHLLADIPKKENSISSSGRQVVFEDDTPFSLLCISASDALIPTPIQEVATQPTSAIFSDLWLAISSLFCFTSATYYMPDEEYIIYTGSMDDGDKNEKESKKSLKRKQSKSFISTSLEVFDWAKESAETKQLPKNALFFSKDGDYANDKLLLGSDLLEEAQRIIKIFLGVTREKGLTFNWILKATKKDINIHTCDVPGSPWLAIKSDCFIRQDKKTILNLMIDDDRSCEYDDSMEGYENLGTLGDELRVRRYYYKGIWPTSPRDFILCSAWKELEDGSIIMCTISPPYGMYPETEGYVRAHVNISGMLIRPIDNKLGGGCAVTMIGHSDLKGNLPSSIVNMLSVGLPVKLMSTLKKILE